MLTLRAPDLCLPNDGKNRPLYQDTFTSNTPLFWTVIIGHRGLKITAFPDFANKFRIYFTRPYCKLQSLRIYYKIPDSGSELENRMMALLYENYSLRIQLALAPVQTLMDKEKGIIIIERQVDPDSIELRFENFTKEGELIAKFLIAQIKQRQKVRY